MSNPVDFNFAREVPASLHSRRPKSFGSVRDMVSVFESNRKETGISSMRQATTEGSIQDAMTNTDEIVADEGSIHKSNVSLSSCIYSNKPFLEIPKKSKPISTGLLLTEPRATESGFLYSPSNICADKDIPSSIQASTEVLLYDSHQESENAYKHEDDDTGDKNITNTIYAPEEEMSNGEVLRALADAHKIEYKVDENALIKSSHLETETVEVSTANESSSSVEIPCNNAPANNDKAVRNITPEIPAQNSTGTETYCLAGNYGSGNESESTWGEDSLIKKFGYKSEANSPEKSPFSDP